MFSQRFGRRSIAAGAVATLILSALVVIGTADAHATPANGSGAVSGLDTANTASIFIRKNDLEYHHLAGAVFSVEGVAGTITTDADGGACFTGLPQDATLKVTEVSPPPGYLLPDPNYQMVHVDNDGDCTSRDVLFVDAPASSSSPSASVSASASASSSASSSASGSASASASASASGSSSGSASASASQSPESSVQGTTGTPEQSVAAATGGPAATFPNTAYAPSGGSSSGILPIFLLGFLVSLGTLASAYAISVRRRR